MHSIFQVAVAVAALSTCGLSFAECNGKSRSLRLAPCWAELVPDAD